MARKVKASDFFDCEEVPEEIEHDLIKDSVLEIAKADFTFDEVEDLPLGNIRKAVSDVDYEGKPVSRKKFESHNWIDKNYLDEEEESEADSFDDGSIFHESDQGSENPSDIGSEESVHSEYDNSEEDDNEENLSSSGSVNENEKNKEDDSDDMEDNKPEVFEGINIFSDKVKDVETDIKKGKAIKNQLIIWEHLIESRIKFQKAVQSCNTFYQPDRYQDFMSSLSAEGVETIKKAEGKFKELLDVLIQVDNALLKNCGDYQKFIKCEGTGQDELATSDEEDGPPIKRMKAGFRKKLRTDGSLRRWRDSVLETWNDRARLAAPRSARFAILEGSILKQLDSALADRFTLVARTRIKRGGEPILGKPVKENSEDAPKDLLTQNQHRTKVQEEDPEIFNDDDFYHKLLKDFIDRKTTNITDPSQLGREWTKLEKMRTKLKRTVDTRATKGRRLRYTVHQKLVNFMAPIRYWTMNEAVEEDLFRSLFGQAAAVTLPSKNADVLNATAP